MSLKRTVQKAVQTGIKAMGDIPVFATYGAVTGTVYDPNTGLITTTSGGGGLVKMIFTSYGIQEIDNVAILKDDQKAIIATLDIGVTPALNDTITKVDSSHWNVISIKQDPAAAAWVLQIRRS